MDGGGRLTEPLKRAWGRSSAGWAKAPQAPSFTSSGVIARAGGRLRWLGSALSTLRRLVGRLLFRRVGSVRLLRHGVGVIACLLLLGASLTFGVVRGGHSAIVVDALHDVRDALANAAGFRIAAVALSGNRQTTREEVLATAGVTGHTSLIFFDVDAARSKLKSNPWIADATVLKLYPDRLQIGITERAPFAVWQFRGKLSVVADDGTVLEPYVARRFTKLPFVVGRGAQKHAKAFLAVLDRYPEIRQEVRAAVMVAERRWNLRLKNGLDVRLPEDGVEGALKRLTELDRDKKILTRDIVAIDLRLPDRVAVRLSDAAAKARDDALKGADKKAKRKGGDA
jgi:cell division protein FtsQ